MSADGAIVIGISSQTPGSTSERAFRWSRVGGLHPLDPLPGDDGTQVVGVDARGAIALGVSKRSIINGKVPSIKSVAVLWYDGGAPRPVDVTLPQLGDGIAPLDPGSLHPIAISANGRGLLGTVFDANSLPQGWTAPLP